MSALARDAAQLRLIELFGPEFDHGKPFELAPLEAALDKLGRPQDALARLVHVAGTNGKGSVIAFLRTIAEAAGLKAHAFTKPHLMNVRERFRVAGALVRDEDLIASAEKVAAESRAITQFDAQVATALLLFSNSSADLAIVETGMGGRDDATNVLPGSKLCLLTPIDFDHVAALGPSLTDIAVHKAGIIKQGSRVISARQRPDARSVIMARCEEVGAPLLLAGRDWDAYRERDRLIVQTDDRLIDLPQPGLLGSHQYENAGLAVMAALALKDGRIGDGALARGVSEAIWPARLHRLTSGPLAARLAPRDLWIDGAHNPHAARALAAFVQGEKQRSPRVAIAIVALRPRKDAGDFLRALGPCVDHLLATQLTDEESVAPGELAALAGALGVFATAHDNFAAAIDAACATPNGLVLVTGSLALAAAALTANGADLA